ATPGGVLEFGGGRPRLAPDATRRELDGGMDERKRAGKLLRRLRGEIDVAFFYEPMTFEGVQVEKLGETTSSVYCGEGHPMFEVEEPELEAVLEYPFSVPGIGDTGRVMDDWPTDLPREIGMRIMRVSTNLTV
ncbi:MAG: LysR substrate-binding domain-containing protein, partial [Bradymonadaceae bacterium]